MKLEFSRQIFEKYSNIKFHENPSSGSRRTGRHDEANSRFSQLCEERLTTLLTPNVNGQHLIMLKVGNKPSRLEKSTFQHLFCCICIQYCIRITSDVQMVRTLSSHLEGPGL